MALENYLAVELMEKRAAKGLNFEYLFLLRILIDRMIIVERIWLAFQVLWMQHLVGHTVDRIRAIR